MARVVRKVSNKAVKGQKRERKGLVFSKKFWIIIISIVVVLAAAGITIGVIVANNNKTTTVEVDDYFGQTQKFKDEDVNFTKMTYQGVLLHTNDNSELFNDYTFVFAASLSSFYPVELIDTNNDNTDLKDKKHELIFNELIELQNAIDKHNKNSENKIYLYIVDTSSKAGNSSDAIYSDSKFSSSDDSTGPLFLFYNADGLQKTVPNDATNSNNDSNKGKTLYSTSYADASNTMLSAISNAIIYVKGAQ